MIEPTKATPRAVLQGIEDNSNRTPPVVAEQVPSHLPLVYLFTERGPSEPQLVAGSSMTATYGSASFDYLGKFANHQTVLARTINAAANAIMVKRLKPADAETAMMRLCVEVIREDLPVYQRDPVTSQFVLDQNGDPVQDGAQTTIGWKLAWRLNPVQVTGDFGQALTGAAGNMSEANGDSSIAGETSVIYPIMDLLVSSWGDYGNRVGMRISAPTSISAVPGNVALAKQVKSFLYRVSMIERPVDSATPNIVGSNFGETAVDVALASGIINPRLGTEMSAEDVLIDRWEDTDTVGQTPKWGPFGDIHVYDTQIAALLDLLVNGDDDATNPAEGEAAFDATSTWRDYDFATAGNENLLNFLTGKDLDGIPYTNFTVVTSGASAGLNLTSSTNLYASGGADGDISLGNFDKLVMNEANTFGDAGNPDKMLNRAKYPCSIIYDSGFSLDTKEALLVPMSRRKDMMVILSTQELGYWADDGEGGEEWVVPIQNTAAKESANAMALKAAAELYPESFIFGTMVCRAAIIGHSGKLINSPWKKLLPLTIDVAEKMARYMGSGNGIWNGTQRFDEAPLNQVTMFKDINATYKEDSTYDRDWENGLVWVQNFDRQRFFYPAFQTVYSDDTSVLNSLITVAACVELEKVADRVWRELTGNTRLSNGQFEERSDALIQEKTQGRFDGRFTIIPETAFSDNDAIRGYSWSTAIKIYANNMRTVGTMTIEAYRQSDLEA